MSKEKMKQMRARGWPAFGLGYGVHTKVFSRGVVQIGREQYFSAALEEHVGQTVFCTLAHEGVTEVYSLDLDKLAGAVLVKDYGTARAAA
jgi:hypothetical protein